MNPTPRANQFWLVLLAVFWAFYGLIGRDAWKGEEALALAPILDLLAGKINFWQAPAPLYAFLAGLCAHATQGLWDLQDGARLASGLFTATALLFTGMGARSLLGPGYGAAAVLALVGSLGLMLRAHALLPETALLATWACLLYGMAVAGKHPRRGAMAIGMAVALLFLGLRGLPDLLASLLALTLPLATAHGRERGYRRALLLGLVLATLLIGAGLALLWQSGSLEGWWSRHGLERLLHPRQPDAAYAELPWFTWPLWPLAAWTLWHTHRRLPRTPEIHAALAALAALLLAALFPAWSRDGGLLPILLPLALLSAFALEHLRRGAAQAFYWFGVLCFLFFAVAFWVYFSAIEWGIPIRLALRMGRLTPGYHAGAVEFQSIVLAAGATLLWLIAIPLFPHAKTRPVLVWATGMILTWTLIAALFRPWIEAGWGYRPLIDDLRAQLPPGACLKAQVDAPMKVMLRYHLGAPSSPDCPWTLKLASRKTASDESEDVIWEGFRPRYKSQVYRLIHHGSR